VRALDIDAGYLESQRIAVWLLSRNIELAVLHHEEGKFFRLGMRQHYTMQGRVDGQVAVYEFEPPVCGVVQ
jgi:hypothetical protein